jgi:hypothetical protein
MLVVANTTDDYLGNVQHPLQHTYACAVPSEDALAALSNIGLPIVELGAGSGYWGALLRNRGVGCVLFDRSPPTDTGRNMYFSRTFTEGLWGEDDKASEYPDHALLLVWPYSEQEANAPWAQSALPWDVRALDAYKGAVVAHVGELEEGVASVATSLPFKKRIAADFYLGCSLELPSWIHCSDRLAIWRRKQ